MDLARSSDLVHCRFSSDPNDCRTGRFGGTWLFATEPATNHMYLSITVRLEYKQPEYKTPNSKHVKSVVFYCLPARRWY